MSKSVAILNGLVNSVEQSKGRFYHELKLPAADEFSHPGWAKVIADHKLGSPGEVIHVKCTLRGYRRTFPLKDGNQGSEVSTVFDFAENMPGAPK